MTIEEVQAVFDNHIAPRFPATDKIPAEMVPTVLYSSGLVLLTVLVTLMGWFGPLIA